MAKPSHRFAYQTKGEVEGLWFLDQEAFKELDSILDEALKDLEAQRKRDIEKGVRIKLSRQETLRARYPTGYKEQTDEEKKNSMKEARQEIEQSYQYSRDKREITIFCSDGRDLHIKRFSDAFALPELENTTPSGFLAEIGCGQGEPMIALNRYGFSRNAIDISVSPHSTDTSSDIFMKLRSWAEGRRQPKWQLFWKNWSGIQIHWTLFFWIFVAMLISSAKQDVKTAEARQLLQKGMTKDDDHKAIELLLSIAADYNKPTDGTPDLAPRPRWFIISSLVLLLACIALSFPVGTAIGIGKGKQILARQKKWLSTLKFVCVAFLFLAIGGSFLGTVIYEYVKK